MDTRRDFLKRLGKTTAAISCALYLPNKLLPTSTKTTYGSNGTTYTGKVQRYAFTTSTQDPTIWKEYK